MKPTFLEIKILVLEKLLNQWMTVRSPVKINTIFFIESMVATLFVITIDALLQRKDGAIRVVKSSYCS